MKTTIYYFSATGNSLTTARLLADHIVPCQLIPVTAVKSLPKLEDYSERIGFVFPVYYSNMPYPVRELISKMTFRADAFIFICTTYRGHPGPIAQRTDQLLKTREQQLSLSVGVPMPGNSFLNAPEEDERAIREQKWRVEKLADQILAGCKMDYSTAELLIPSPVTSLGNFRGLMADDSCTGCGICTRVCPMGNISILNGRAIIGDICATCLTCFHWCPKESIFMSREASIARRKKYRHPEVRSEEFLLR